MESATPKATQLTVQHRLDERSPACPAESESDWSRGHIHLHGSR